MNVNAEFAMLLLSNLARHKEITDLEREAIALGIRALEQTKRLAHDYVVAHDQAKEGVKV